MQCWAVRTHLVAHAEQEAHVVVVGNRDHGFVRAIFAWAFVLRRILCMMSAGARLGARSQAGGVSGMLCVLFFSHLETGLHLVHVLGRWLASNALMGCA